LVIITINFLKKKNKKNIYIQHLKQAHKDLQKRVEELEDKENK